MRVSTKLSIAALMPTVVMLAVGAALIVSYRSLMALEEKQMAAYRISDAMGELNDLVRNYVLHHEERPRQQFLLKHQEAARLVAAARFEGPQRQLLANVGENMELVEALFRKLISSHELRGHRGDDALSGEADERLAGQLLIRSRNAKTEASRLVAMISRDIAASQRRMSAFVLVFMGLIAAAQFGVLTRLTRSIAFSLEKLRKGTEAVGIGGLEYRIGISSDDEFGDLARDFDRMSGKLQETTVSRDELSAEVAVRRKAEEALRESEHRYATTLASIGDAVIATDAMGRIAFMNAVAEEMTGWSLADAVTHPVTQVFRIINEQTRGVVEDPVAKVLKLGMIVGLANHTLLVRKDGTEIPIDDSGAPIKNRNGETTGVVLVFRDIAERRRAEEEREITMEFLRLVNENRAEKDLIRAATGFFQNRSGCEAVGLRLRQGDDYPYNEARGFPEEFVLAENRLCTRDGNGEVVRDGNCNPVIECMCGKVICGRFERSKPFFTANGSFWTNSTTDLLAGITEEDRQACMRNRCNGEGYESVALIPLRVGQERLGLVQLNDRRKGMFSAEGVAVLERLGDYLSVALANAQAEEALRASLADKDVLMRELAHRTKNNMQMISSLLALQAAASPDENFVRAVLETQGRIRAMALVHENLYRSGNIASLDIKDYVENLLNALLGAHQAPGAFVRANLDMEELFLSIDGALPCGLIINELVSNSLKHAFHGGKSGNIFLSLRRVGEKVELRYRDDGPGLPRDLDLSRIKSLGLKLVHGLAVRQLRGTMEIRHEPVWELVFTFGRIAQVERM